MATLKEQEVGRAGMAQVVPSGPGSWTQVSCPCCVSNRVEPLVLIQLAPNVQAVTKKWIMAQISAPEREGEAVLLAHPGEDMEVGVIVVSAPRCSLLRATEELGLCKPYRDGSIAAFSYQDRHNFQNVDDVQQFLTLAERQHMVKLELDGRRAARTQRIPGVHEAKGLLKPMDNIFQKLAKAGVVQDIFPLHDPERLQALGKEWYSQKSLWGQPLDAIRSYFGDSVAFYFSFLDFYTWALVPPALLGVLLSLLGSSADAEGAKPDGMPRSGAPSPGVEEEDNPSVSGLMVQAVFSMLWSTVFMELWKRRSATLSYRWGTLHLAEHFGEPRPGFHGTIGTNPVTGRVEPLFPEWQRNLRVGLVSVPVVGLFLGLVVLGMAGFYYGEGKVSDLHLQSEGSILTAALLYLPSILHIVYTNMLGNVYRSAAKRLTEWENHREESSFQNHHTTKVLVFTFFNYFAVLFHIAFFKQDLPLLRKRLASLLIVTQLVNQVTEIVVPFVVDHFFSSHEKEVKEDDPEEDKFHAQGSLPPFPGLFGEYIELLVQFGYLSLFSCVYPLTAVLLLLNNVLEIRCDAFKLCKLFRKPFSCLAADMGVWQPAFEVLGFISVMSNCWLLLLSPRMRDFTMETGFSSRNVLLLAIMVEHVLIAAKLILAFMIPDEPGWIRIKREQIEYHSVMALNQQKD